MTRYYRFLNYETNLAGKIWQQQAADLYWCSETVLSWLKIIFALLGNSKAELSVNYWLVSTVRFQYRF